MRCYFLVLLIFHAELYRLLRFVLNHTVGLNDFFKLSDRVKYAINIQLVPT